MESEPTDLIEIQLRKLWHRGFQLHARRRIANRNNAPLEEQKRLKREMKAISREQYRLKMLRQKHISG